MAMYNPNHAKNVLMRIIDSGWEEIDKGLLHEKEIKFNIHVEIKNNKRNALIGYFGLLTESGKEISVKLSQEEITFVWVGEKLITNGLKKMVLNHLQKQKSLSKVMGVCWISMRN